MTLHADIARSFNKRPLDHNAHLRIIPWQYLSLNKAMIICIRWLNGVIIFPLQEGLAFHLIHEKKLSSPKDDFC